MDLSLYKSESQIEKLSPFKRKAANETTLQNRSKSSSAKKSRVSRQHTKVTTHSHKRSKSQHDDEDEDEDEEESTESDEDYRPSKKKSIFTAERLNKSATRGKEKNSQVIM